MEFFIFRGLSTKAKRFKGTYYSYRISADSGPLFPLVNSIDIIDSHPFVMPSPHTHIFISEYALTR